MSGIYLSYALDFELSDADMKSLETSEYAPIGWDPTRSFD